MQSFSSHFVMLKWVNYTFLTVLTLDLLATSGDVTLTWTSPVLPKLHSDDLAVNPLGRPITPDEESWIGSLINIGALIGPLPFGLLAEKMGRKFSLLCMAIPYIASSAILAFVPNIYWYYFARLLAGLSGGGSCVLLPMYVAEVAEDSNRGTLSVTLNIFWTLGTLVPYVLGPFMQMLAFNVTLACIPSIFFLLFLVIAPETPYFLVNNQRIHQAEEALMKLRSRSRSAVAKEIAHIKTVLEGDERGKIMDLFTSKSNLKALAISLGLILLQQFSGINAILFYTQLIFEDTGADIPSYIASMIIGLVMFVSSFITPIFADRWGRKFFLTSSAVGMMVSLTIFGTYFYLKESTLIDVGFVSWLPILSLVLYIISFNFGFGCVVWTVISELFPISVKSLAASLIAVTLWVASCIVTKFFNDFTRSLGVAGTFWMFGGFCLVGVVFTVLCLPETRGKSFREIQEALAR